MLVRSVNLVQLTHSSFIFIYYRKIKHITIWIVIIDHHLTFLLEVFQVSKRTISPKKDEKNKLINIITGEWDGKIDDEQLDYHELRKGAFPYLHKIKT